MYVYKYNSTILVSMLVADHCCQHESSPCYPFQAHVVWCSHIPDKESWLQDKKGSVCQPHCKDAQSIGFLSTEDSLASGEPSSGRTLYLQAINGGADTMIDSKRPPERPNLTPLSYNKLNSRYLPRLSNCHCLCLSVKGMVSLSVAMSFQLGMKP